uniref:C2 domain-containing protein n=1 Tax=Tetranychus urticae TaxID=32264 RepID=T1KMI0_TETUR
MNNNQEAVADEMNEDHQAEIQSIINQRMGEQPPSRPPRTHRKRHLMESSLSFDGFNHIKHSNQLANHQSTVSSDSIKHRIWPPNLVSWDKSACTCYPVFQECSTLPFCSHEFDENDLYKINTVKYLQEYNSNSDCPLNKVKYCLTFDIIRHNWCNTVWTCLNERISETLLMGSIFHPSLLLSTLDINMNCQLSGTETGLGNFSQTKPTTSPLPQSSPPSTSPNCLPPPTLPAQSTTTTTPRKISPSSLKPGFIESQVKTTDDTIADVLNDYDNNDDDDDVGKNADCGGTGSRNKKNISRGSNNSWKEAVRPDVEDHNSRVKKAPIRNQSEEESYTRSELENKDKTTAKASQINGIKGNKFNSDLVNGLHVSNSLNLINHDTDNDHIFVSQVKSTFNCENDDQSEHINCLNSNINNQQQQQQPKSDQFCELTKPTSYLDLSTLNPHLATCHVKYNNVFHKYDHCLTQNQNCKSPTNLIKSNTCENLEWINTSQNSTLNLLSPTIKNTEKSESIDGNCNIVDEEEEEYIVDDDNSTSSDESFPPPTLPNHSLGGIYSGFGNGLTGVGNNSNYGNPLAYSLHTIIEESCEESEPESLLSRISETNDGKGGNLAGCLMIPPSSSSTLGDPGDLGDPENYTAFQIGRNVINKRDSFAESETGTDYSDSLSETSENIADFGDEMDPLTLASSRLEKYFTSGLLGSGAYDYPDDVEFQDEPDDLYNQAKRASIKVEMKPNNNKSDESNSNHSNSKLNGIQSISESNVINNSLVTTQATFTPPTIKSLLSSQTESTPTISVDSKLKSSPIITLSTPPTVIHDTTIQSKDDDDDGKKENIEDYFTDTVKRKHINESKSEKDCIPRGHNKENNESQIVNTILNVIEKPLSNNQLIDSSNCVDKVKEILTESSLTKNEEYNKKTDNDELTRNVTIEVRSTTPTKPATPSSAIKNVNLITDNNNTKSTVINNCKTNQSTSRTDSSNSPMSFTKSNYSGDKFNSGYHKKEAAPPVPTIYTPANKPTVESTIRFGPSPQLVRSLLAVIVMNWKHLLLTNFLDDDNGSEETRKAPTKCEISPEMEESFVKFVEPLPGKISDYQQMESKTSNKKMTKIINNQTLDEKEEAKDKSKDGKRKGKTEEEKFALKIVSKDLVDDNGRLNSLQTRTSLFTNVERNSTRESEEDDKTVNERQQFSSLSSSSKSPETSLNRSQAYIQLDNVEEENGSFNGDTINTIYERIHDVYQINANPVKHTFNHLHNHFDKHLENDLMEKCSAIIEEKGDLHGFPGKCNPSGEIVQTSRLNHKTILKIDVNGDEDDDDKVNSSDVSLLPKSLVNHNFLSDESTFFDDKYFESNETIKRQQILIPSTKISILTAPSSSTTTRVTTITRGGGRDESTDEDKEVNFNKPNFNNSENEKLESAWETCSLLISRVALKNSSEFDEGSLVGNNIISSSTTETPCSLPMVAIEKSPSSSPLPIIGLRLMADCKIKGKPEHRDTGYYSFQSSDENVKDKSYSEDDDYDNNNYDDNGYKPIMVKTILAGKGQAESVSSTPVTTKVVINCDPQSQNNDNDKPFVASVDDDKNFNSIDYKSSDYSSKKRFTSSSSVLPKILQMDETLAFKKVNLSSIEINSKTDSLASKNDSKQHYQPEKAKHHNLDHHPSHHHHHHVTFNRLRTSFFSSSSGLFRKLASLRDEKSSNRRLGTRKRVMLGGSEPCPSNESTSAVPHISVSDYSESFSHRGSIGSSGEEIFISAEDDIDKAFAYHNRSQTSLSSFGVRSESLSSVYSAAGGGRYGTVTVSGEILFSLNYQPSEGSLELYIKECRNLSPVDSKRNRSDPYVKLYLLPDRSKSGKRKTKVKKHTLNPVFDESLKFYLPSNQTEGRTLWISVWHSDIFGRNDFLGEVTLPLTKEILKNSGLRWYPLQERIDLLESNHNYKGDIFIALKFVPSESSPSKGSNNKNGLQGKLLVLVKEAHNLMPTRSNGTSDPFVKCYLLPDKSKKHKTPVIKKTINPRWNHTFEFDDVTTNGLKDRCLELTVWDYDKLTSNDFLGGVRLSLGQGVYDGKPVDWLDSSEEEMMLWKQMLDRTDMWVYGELCLRSSLQSRATLLR